MSIFPRAYKVESSIFEMFGAGSSSDGLIWCGSGMDHLDYICTGWVMNIPRTVRWQTAHILLTVWRWIILQTQLKKKIPDPTLEIGIICAFIAPYSCYASLLALFCCHRFTCAATRPQITIYSYRPSTGPQKRQQQRAPAKKKYRKFKFAETHTHSLA